MIYFKDWWSYGDDCILQTFKGVLAGDKKIVDICIYDKENLTIILISHNMDDIARFANRIIILSQGKVLADDTPRKIFNETNILQKAGLIAPSTIQLLNHSTLNRNIQY